MDDGTVEAMDTLTRALETIEVAEMKESNRTHGHRHHSAIPEAGS